MKDKYMADKPCEKCVPSRLMPRKSTAEDWGVFHKTNCRICAPFKEWQNRPLWELKQKMKEIPTASLIAELEKRRPCGKCEYVGFSGFRVKAPCDACTWGIRTDNFKPAK